MNLPVWIPLLEDCRFYTKAATLASAAFHTQDGISAKKLKIFLGRGVSPSLSVCDAGNYLYICFSSCEQRSSLWRTIGLPPLLATGFKDN